MSPIGVFDSGHGGLTILRALTDAAPGRQFVFLGDHGHAPYGRRSMETIYDLTLQGIETLFAEGCRLVILACNTSAAVALRRLQQTWLPRTYPDRNVLGVLVPVVEAITRVPWVMESPPPNRRPEPRTVGVFATVATVSCGSFPKEIVKRAPDVRVIQQSCPDLVTLIEDGAPDDKVAPLVRGYATEMLDQLGGRSLDTVVLGCTHYPLVAHLFREVLPAGVEFLNQPNLVARSFEHYLARHPEYDAPVYHKPIPVRFLTTGNPETVGPLASRFFGSPAAFGKVE